MNCARDNALRCQAIKCRDEMLKTKKQSERRYITDKYMQSLRLLGFNKSELLYEIYLMRGDR